VTRGGDGGWSKPTRIGATDRPEPPRSSRDTASDVRYARRPASFGGGGPRFGDAVREFVRRYGWRAYALPILVIVTVVALFTTTSGSPKPAADPGPLTGRSGHPAPSPTADQKVGDSTGPPVAPSSIPLKSDDATGSSHVNTHLLTNAKLPAGPDYTMRGKGTFRVIPGTSPIAGKTGDLYRYDIEVERGITGVDVDQFASMVERTLADPRSWSGHGVRVKRVDSGTIDFHVSLTTSMTVRKFCGYTIPVETSCYATAYSAPGVTVNRVVMNDARWVRGAASYVGDLHSYRLYMINHEDGHAMGHEHAHQCLPDGLAPVMMQQTFGLKSATTGQYCEANPWPYPPGVKGTPGAEQPDTAQNNEYYLGD
jgi:hypothetical protein